MKNKMILLSLLVLLSSAYGFSQTKIFWSGSDDNQWFNANNWDGNSIPTAVDHAVIPNNCAYYPSEFSEDALELDSLTIDDAAQLILPEEGFDFSCNSPVTLRYNDASRAIFYHHLSDIEINNEVSYSANIYRAITSTIQDGVTGIFSGSVLYEFDPFENQWSAILDAGLPLPPGKGYFVYREEDYTYHLQGNANTGDVEIPLQFAECRGNSFIGNPYTTFIDWDLVTERNEVDKAIYLWSIEEANYKVWNGHIGNANKGIIKPGDGFFVKVESEDAFLTFTEDCKSDSYDKEVEDWYKNYIECEISDGKYTDITYLAFLEEATDAYDFEMDAEKFAGYTFSPDIYTMGIDENCGLIDTLPYSINVLGYNYFNPMIRRLYVESGDSTDYTLHFKAHHNNAFNQWIDFFLIDSLLNTETIIEDELEISFSTTPNTLIDNRFYLKFELSNGVPENQQKYFRIYASNHQLHITNNYNSAYPLAIYDIMGRELYKGNLQQGDNSISLNADRQYIIIQVNYENGINTRKFFFHQSMQ
jgi:hypothetical protein